jgi:hypothetical protein
MPGLPRQAWDQREETDGFCGFAVFHRCIALIRMENWWKENMLVVSTNGLVAPFIHKNEHFTKTGSGQT